MRFLKRFKKEENVLSETELLAAYRQTGELYLVGKLYEPYMQLVFALCYKYFKNKEESEDAVMNIFEKLVVELRNHQVDNFKSWLYSVARNHCLMSLRSAKVLIDNVGFEVGEEVGDAYLSSRDFLSEELEENLVAMEKCMEGLATEQRTAVNLFYIQEKCYKEIADETGFELGKVKSFIQNGKRNLKICLENNGKR